jgi:flavin-dependent dehydrogenase
MPRVGSAIVIGGGPAGSVAATMLARSGVAVTLIEQSRFPRDKACGECVSDLGARTLIGQDLFAPLHELTPVLLTRACFVPAGQSPIAFELRLDAPMLGITRRRMDAALLEAARDSGATIRQPARVIDIPPGFPPAISLRDLVRNSVESLGADVILVADGRGHLAGGKPPATGDLGLKAHFEGVDAHPDTIHLFGLHHHYAGLAAVSDGDRTLWNLACNVPAALVRRHRGDHEALLADMRAQNSALDRALRPATRAGDWLACPLPRFAVQGRWPPGVIPIGNAAAALEPIGGEGMGLAIASAALAARFVVENGAENATALRKAFQRMWRGRRFACRTTALLLSRPLAGRMAISAARLAPPLVAALAGMAGKGPATRHIRRGVKGCGTFRLNGV